MIKIFEGCLEDAWRMSQQIPEFENHYSLDKYHTTLDQKRSLILIAKHNEIPVGFKVGYDRYQDGSLYSWMGGVLPAYRRQGIANQLAEFQESWAKKQGFASIRFRTRNKHTAMLQFALGRGFSIIGFDPRVPNEESRITLDKML